MDGGGGDGMETAKKVTADIGQHRREDRDAADSAMMIRAMRSMIARAFAGVQTARPVYLTA